MDDHNVVIEEEIRIEYYEEWQREDEVQKNYVANPDERVDIPSPIIVHPVQPIQNIQHPLAPIGHKERVEHDDEQKFDDVKFSYSNPEEPHYSDDYSDQSAKSNDEMEADYYSDQSDHNEIRSQHEYEEEKSYEYQDQEEYNSEPDH
eukprot:766175_1